MKKIINNIRVNVNNIRTIIIILIGVTILFTILGAFNLSPKENMEDHTSQCYPDYVVDSNPGQIDGQIDDKYILKTKIVPPKGTACPTEISKPASKYLEDVDKPTQDETQLLVSNESSNSDSTSNYTSITDSQAASPAPAPVDSTPSPANNNSMDKYTPINQSTQPLNQGTPQKNETCPPCPACERCPEPAFECKKVPNYRSPSIDNYMPVPVLNDFSKF